MPEHWLTNRNVQCMSAKLKIVHGRGPSNINLRIFVCSFKVYRFTSPCWLRDLEDTNKVNWITYSLGFQKTSQYLSDKSLSVTNEMAERSTPDLFFITRLTLKGINRANLIWHWRVFFFFVLILYTQILAVSKLQTLYQKTQIVFWGACGATRAATPQCKKG